MKSLKLNKLNMNQLSKEQLSTIRGGSAPSCTCGCCYANSGGSNTTDNGMANYEGGLKTMCKEITMVISG